MSLRRLGKARQIDVSMDDRSKEHNADHEFRKRTDFVFGSLMHARTSSLKLLGMLIVMEFAQLSSTAQGQDLFLAVSQQNSPGHPVASVLDWAFPNRSTSSLPTSSKFFSASQLSPDNVFQSVSMAVRSPGMCELVAEKPQIPWSRWSEGRSYCRFATHDFATLFRNLDNDFVALWRLRNVAFVGAGLGLSLGLRDSVDDDVRDYTARHPGRWGNFTDALGVLGNTEFQVAGMAALYGYAYHQRDDELMNFTRLLVRSYSMTGLSTLLIKGIANTDRPSDTWNNGHFGFPSAHVSTSFAIAATIEEYYGPKAGLPAYLTAGLIGWSRIDDRDHDLSDVVFGAVLGYAIAKSIAGQELRGDSRIRMFPWTDPGNRTVGTMWEIEF